ASRFARGSKGATRSGPSSAPRSWISGLAMPLTLAKVSREGWPIPSLLAQMGEQITRISDRIEICHESFGDPADPPLLLVMGLGMQMVGWHDEFCRRLAERGFYVVRFDNRDAGRSTHFDFRPPTLRQLVTRRFAAEQYTLADMAGD